MDGPRERNSDRFLMYQRYLRYFTARTFPGSHPGQRCTSGGSLGGENTGANPILFHLESWPCFLPHTYPFVHIYLALQGFDYIINGYCKDRAGNRLIKRGDYRLIQAQTGQMIGRSDFVSTVEPGMIVEMSVVLRQKKAFKDDRNKCPRCGHINLNVTVESGWIEWKVISNFGRC